MVERDSAFHRQVYLEVETYVYRSRFIGTLTRFGHKACSRLRKYDKQGCTVVDLGCGPGIHFQYIKNANITGLDNMDEMLDMARELTPQYGDRLRLLKGDLLDIPLEDESVESCIASGVFEHFSNLEIVVKGVYRILKPGGEIIVLQSSEGFLYELGRWLTTGRHVRKTMGIDYKKYLESEHVIDCNEVLSILGKYFRKTGTIGIPCIISSLKINAFVAVRFEKE